MGIKKDTRNIIELIQREKTYSLNKTGIKNNTHNIIELIQRDGKIYIERENILAQKHGY